MKFSIHQNFLDQHYLIELSGTMEIFYSVLSNIVDSYIGLLST